MVWNENIDCITSGWFEMHSIDVSTDDIVLFSNFCYTFRVKELVLLKMCTDSSRLFVAKEPNCLAANGVFLFLGNWRLLVSIVCLVTIASIVYLNHASTLARVERPELADIYDPSKRFLEYVRIKCRRLGINYTSTEQYCLQGTTVDNCRLNWSRILSELPNRMQLMKLESENGHHCMTAGFDKTCFETNGTLQSQRVTLYKQRLDSNVFELVDQVESVYDAKLILAYTATDMIVIEDHYDFCFLSLFDNTCLYYDY